jgi:hypothetical protein
MTPLLINICSIVGVRITRPDKIPRNPVETEYIRKWSKAIGIFFLAPIYINSERLDFPSINNKIKSQKTVDWLY